MVPNISLTTTSWYTEEHSHQVVILVNLFIFDEIKKVFDSLSEVYDCREKGSVCKFYRYTALYVMGLKISSLYSANSKTAVY